MELPHTVMLYAILYRRETSEKSNCSLRLQNFVSISGLTAFKSKLEGETSI